jgi:hypothetical protein
MTVPVVQICRSLNTENSAGAGFLSGDYRGHYATLSSVKKTPPKRGLMFTLQFCLVILVPYLCCSTYAYKAHA